MVWPGGGTGRFGAFGSGAWVPSEVPDFRHLPRFAGFAGGRGAGQGEPGLLGPTDAGRSCDADVRWWCEVAAGGCGQPPGGSVTGTRGLAGWVWVRLLAGGMAGAGLARMVGAAQITAAARRVRA